MMKEEFERIIGYEIQESAYRTIIEPMYMATDLSKEEFAKVVNCKQFKVEKNQERIDLENELKAQIADAQQTIREYQDDIERYKWYLLDTVDKAERDSWKHSIKTKEKYIAELKRDIKGMKWVLA